MCIAYRNDHPNDVYKNLSEREKVQEVARRLISTSVYKFSSGTVEEWEAYNRGIQSFANLYERLEKEINNKNG